jgi:hypothetical protein
MMTATRMNQDLDEEAAEAHTHYPIAHFDTNTTGRLMDLMVDTHSTTDRDLLDLSSDAGSDFQPDDDWDPNDNEATDAEHQHTPDLLFQTAPPIQVRKERVQHTNHSKTAASSTRQIDGFHDAFQDEVVQDDDWFEDPEFSIEPTASSSEQPHSSSPTPEQQQNETPQESPPSPTELEIV